MECDDHPPQPAAALDAATSHERPPPLAAPARGAPTEPVEYLDVDAFRYSMAGHDGETHDVPPRGKRKGREGHGPIPTRRGFPLLGQNGMGSNISRNPPQDGRKLVPCAIRSQMKNFFVKAVKASKRQSFPETFGWKTPVAGVSENANCFDAL